MISFYVVPLTLVNGLVVMTVLLLDGLSILICIAVTMGLINAGAIWLIRFVMDRWCQSAPQGLSSSNDVPIAAGTAIG